MTPPVLPENKMGSSLDSFVIIQTIANWWWKNNTDHDGARWPGNPMAEPGEKVLLLLNWITFCLVRDSTDQSIASVLHFDTPATMTFLLAAKIPPSPEQLVYTRRFFSTLEGIISRQVSCSVAGIEPLPQEEITREFLTVVGRDAYKRAHRKAVKLDEVGPHYGLGSTQTKLRKFYIKGPSDQYTMVDDAYTGILSHTPLLLSLNEEARVDALLTITHYAQVILESDFMKSREDEISRPSRRDMAECFIFHFARRLRLLFFYRFGAYNLSGKGAKSLRRLFASGWRIHHEWIPTPEPVIFRFPQHSTTMMRDIIRDNHNRTISVDEIRTVLNLVHDVPTEELWREGDEKIFYTHPEVQITAHLRHNDITVRKRTIGCSKRACRFCYDLVYLPSRIDTPKLFYRSGWKATHTSFKIPSDWICLDDAMGESMTRSIDKISGRLFGRALEELAFKESDYKTALNALLDPSASCLIS